MNPETVCIYTKQNEGYDIAKNRIEMWKLFENPEVTLDLDELQFDRLPPIPENVRYLRCGNNRLTKLEHLPRGLQKIWCHGNKLQDIIGLPNTLQYINLTCNYELESIDDLPDSIHTIELCECSNILVINRFPKNCRNIWIDSVDNLYHINSFPPNLRKLHIHETRIQNLPTLPSTLRIFECTHSRLINLPIFPTGIRYIHCDCSSIDNYLQQIPEGVYYLNISVRNHTINCIMCTQYQYKLEHLPTYIQKICNDYSIHTYVYDETLYNKYKQFILNLPKSIIVFESDYNELSFHKQPDWTFCKRLKSYTYL